MSRTDKSIQNSKVALLYAAVIFVIGFFSRKIFLDHLGAELLGLNTTAVNLLQFLNLAEMGIGSAIACTLYKPLFDRNQQTINEIISLNGWLYRNIAFVIMGAAAILMGFFPLIFAKSDLPIWYAYATFSVLLFSSLLDYFVNYKQVLLSANQQQYKIVYSYSLVKSLRVVFQIVALLNFENGYIWWLAIEFLFSIIASVTLNLTIARSAPELKANVKLGASLRKRYPEIITKVKQVFIHRIGGFVLAHTQPFIIYAYASLSVVAYYGNYMFIVSGITQLVTALFNGMAASVGNLVAEGDRERIIRIFDELYTSRFLYVAVLALTTYVVAPQFITLWVGAEYILPQSTVILILVTFFIRGIKITVEEYLYAHGQFSDTWAPMVEALLNVGLSVLLGYFFGIDGVLCGAIISLVVIILCWKPLFLFKWGLREPLSTYLVIFAKNLAALAAAILFINTIDLVAFASISRSGLLNFLVCGAVTVVAVSLVMSAVLFPISRGFRDFVVRLKGVVLR